MNLAWPALGWGLLILAAFVGWGRLTARLIAPGLAPTWGLQAGWGVAVTSLLGGLANLARAFSPVTVAGYVIAGAVLWLGFAVRDRASIAAALRAGGRALRGDWLLAVLVLLLVAIVGLRYVSSPVRYSYQAHENFLGMPFNMHDDVQSYLVMPEKLLQLGHLAPDPYNDRQLEATLGGMHVLTALARCVLPFRQLHLLEDGVGVIMLGGAVGGLLLSLGLSTRLRIALVLVAQCSIGANLNLSSYLTAAAIFAALLSLLRTREERTFLSVRWSIALGLLLAGAASLKSPLAPIAALLVGFTLAVRLIAQPDRRIWQVLMVTTVLVPALLLPWMWVKYQTYGTPFFPLLGRGNHWTNQLTVPADATLGAWEIFLRENGYYLRQPLAIALVVGALWLVPALRRRCAPPERAVALAIAVTWVTSVLAMGLIGGGFGISRYLIPLVVTAVPLLLGMLWRLPTAAPLSAGGRRVAAIVWCVALAGWLWQYRGQTYVPLHLAVRDDLDPAKIPFPIDTPERRTQTQRLQSRVPAGEPIFARVSHPYLLDFQRNPVFVADWPGAASPPPGLPAFDTAEALARYLLAQKIRYVAYSYGNEALFQYALYSWRARPDQPHWERQVARMTFAVQANLLELAYTRHRVHDDGEACVIDLARMSGQLPPLRRRP